MARERGVIYSVKPSRGGFSIALQQPDERIWLVLKKEHPNYDACVATLLTAASGRNQVLVSVNGNNEIKSFEYFPSRFNITN